MEKHLLWRDITIWVAAVGLIVYEAVFFDGEPRQALLILYAGMLGLPAFLRYGERANKETSD